VPIAPEETAPDVFHALSSIGADLMVETLAGLAAATIDPQPQDHALATLAPILTREDGAIDFTRGAQQIYDRWRGFQPWPGAHTLLRGKKLIVHRLHVAAAEASGSLDPAVLSVLTDEILVGCGSGTVLALDEVQMEGKRRMNAAEFLRGYQVRSGERLGP
jgi:methionyl-tRNA formyltransferase